jgi:hypothetical protein
MKTNTVKKLVLKKETLRNLAVKSGVGFAASVISQRTTTQK